MPIYEYRCTNCGRRSSRFYRTVRAAEAAGEASECPFCHLATLARLPSRITVHTSEGERLDAMADESMMRALESDDPHAAAAMMRHMSDTLGEPMDDATRDMVDRLDSGEIP